MVREDKNMTTCPHCGKVVKNSKSLKTIKKLSVDQRSITRLGSFNNDVWYKIY